jgi:hypothetical protein
MRLSSEKFLRCMACSVSVQVFAKAHVEHPVQLVFDGPVLADDPVQPCCIGPEAGDLVAGFALGLARRFVVTLALDAYQSL